MSYFDSESPHTPTGLTPGPTGGVIAAGGPFAAITNLHRSSGLWAPVYPWSVANESLTELAGGAIRLQETVRTVDRLQRIGIRARFRVFPDPADGLISLRLDMANMVFANNAGAHDCNCGIWWGEFDGGGGPLVTMFGLGLSNTNTNTVYAHETIGWNNGPPNITAKNNAIVGGNGFVIASVRLNFTFTIGVGGSDDISASPYEYSVNGGAFLPYVPAALRCPGYGLTKGLEIFCGLFGSQREVITVDMIGFTIEKGYAVL